MSSLPISRASAVTVPLLIEALSFTFHSSWLRIAFEISNSSNIANCLYGRRNRGGQNKKPRPGTRARASISGTISAPREAHPSDYTFNEWEKTLCRGRRPYHAQRDHVGTWEIPRLASGGKPPWSASGRRGAEADDARAWEVRLRLLEKFKRRAPAYSQY